MELIQIDLNRPELGWDVELLPVLGAEKSC